MTRVNLYKATSLAELNKLAAKPVTLCNPQIVKTTMDEFFQRALECRQRDEETAYIFLMRYFDCYERLKYLAGNTVKSAMFTTHIKRQTLLAMDYLESLHKSLEKRYEAAHRAQTDSVHRLPTPPDSPIHNTHQAKQGLMCITTPYILAEDAPSVPQKVPTGWISSTELVSRMRERKDTLLIFDLQPESSYEKCHIKWNPLINFPGDKHLTRGTTFTVLSTALSKSPFAAYWQDRGRFDQIVLLDENSGHGMTDIPVGKALPRSHPLILMKDALFKWDAAGVVKTEPVILSGGMREFLSLYAPLTSSPDHRIERSDRDQSSSGTGPPASDIEYPDMVAKDREFAEAQRRRKRKEEEEAARRKKAAATAAAISKGPRSTARKEPSTKAPGPDSVTENDEHKCPSVSNSLSLVPSSKPPPGPSDESPADVDLEERLRALRVCKPKLSIPIVSKPSEVVDSIFLQPPQVDRTRKPSVPSNSTPNSSDAIPQSISSQRNLTPEESAVSNGINHSKSSHDVIALSVADCAVLPNQLAPETGMSKSGSAQAHLGSITEQMLSDQNPTAHPINTPSISRASSLAKLPHIFPSCHEQPLGLRNLGNTCYMNAVIQSLAHTRALVTFFLRCLDKELTNFSNPLGYGGAVSTQFQRLFTAVWSATDCSPELIQFKNVVSKHCSTFAGSDQQDSLEFLLFLLDGLHEDMNEARKGSLAVTQSGEQVDEDNENLNPQQRAALAWERHLGANKSVIVSSFQSYDMTKVSCCPPSGVGAVTNVPRNSTLFMCLSLPLPDLSACTLQTCMTMFGNPEQMEDQWFCPRCKRRTDATKSLTVWRLPTYLIIHLKRFRYQEGSWRKSTIYVNFPVDDYTPQLDKGIYSLYGVIVSFQVNSLQFFIGSRFDDSQFDWCFIPCLGTNMVTMKNH
ncbi:Ubiquitin-specific peptidase 8 (C19 family) [Fasciola gigantica]|uniref:ubiquitinyl hydrolase 1 n=1 Tax=Fasciola gigantica TaxID=46835 RepID=A0A504YX53_FASGI|nr:Ubiquitin-specific peptidase 8 (C19 family) [Fasciola gigantica]